MMHHTAAADLTYHSSTPTNIRTYADPRAAARGKQRERKRRQKYYDFKLIPEADVARAASTRVLTPELNLGGDIQHDLYIRTGRCIYSCMAGEMDPGMVLNGKRTVWKKVNDLSTVCIGDSVPRSTIGKNPVHGLFNDTRGVQQLWEVELGEREGLDEAFEASLENQHDFLGWQEYHPALWDLSSVPMPEEEDDGVDEDWHFVDNWLAVVSDSEQDSDSADWDLLSADTDTGLYCRLNERASTVDR